MRVLCLGAHPDDCEGSVGGTAIRFRRRGDDVTFVSATDGSRGHFDPMYLADPRALIERRREESLAGVAPHGIGYEWLGLRDGEVVVTLAWTEATIRLIRRSEPDLLLMNRPNDYHRDHRYTAQLALDASYLLTVPFVCPEVPPLRMMPVIAYWQDGFNEGGEFRPDVAVPIDDVLDEKVSMMMAHESQYLEWLPYNATHGERLGGLPEEPEARRAEVRLRLATGSRHTAERFAARLPGGSRYAEAFQISEYGARPKPEDLPRLFPL